MARCRPSVQPPQFFGAAVIVLLGLLASPPAPVCAASTEEILGQIEAIDPTLESYKANIEFTVGLHLPLPMHRTLHGVTYFKRPARMEVVFADLPAIAQQFRNVYVGLGVPQEWQKKFSIASARTRDGRDQLIMTPRKADGRLETVTVDLDGPSRLPEHVLWTYRDGSIDMRQKIVSIEGHYVVGSQHAEIKLPGVSAWINAKIGNYAFNVPIDDAVFTKKPEPAHS